MNKKLIFPSVLLLWLVTACSVDHVPGRQVLFVLYSKDPISVESQHCLFGYFNHLGIAFDTLDIFNKEAPLWLSRYNLVVVARNSLQLAGKEKKNSFSGSLRIAVKRGTGLVTFDEETFIGKGSLSGFIAVDTLDFSKAVDYITILHSPSEKMRLFDKMKMPVYTSYKGSALISADGIPLVWTDSSSKGRVVCWATDEWMKTKVLGPLGGLDDCLWRSMVWAARKPFIMRGLPPIVTMRVDDVAGRGGLWGKSPLYWVNTSKKYGLKPWLGLFTYNLTPEAVNELRGYLLEGDATASPHAFGRPPRSNINNLDIGQYAKSGNHDLYAGFYYNTDAMPLREKEYDEFIFFDHQHSNPWTDSEAKRGLEAVDKWYSDNSPLPKSNYFLPHWYEAGSNVIAHISENWGMEFIAQNKEIDKPWNDSVPWVKQGPFRLYEEAGTSTNNPSRDLRGTNPVYYADFTEIAGHRFFNCFTEIRDDAGYEWAPDNDIEATAGRGIRQLRRALNSMALAVLFTHETDYIYRIKPETWDRELQLVTEGIKSCQPVYMTMDEALKEVRSTKTSCIENIIVIPGKSALKISLTGMSDVSSTLWMFNESKSGIRQELIKIPKFEKHIDVIADF